MSDADTFALQEVDEREHWTPTEVEQALRAELFNLWDVIDAVIQANAIIGVGKFSLADDVAEYIKSHKGYDPRKEQ